jgi:RNA polymerase sigma-70 factor (ECF subfamily)
MDARKSACAMAWLFDARECQSCSRDSKRLFITVLYTLATNATGQDLTESLTLQRELNHFLADVERRALRMAEIAVRDRDEALDIVQESMIRLARRYGRRQPAEWRPLFYRILRNRINDWHRRQRVRRALFGHTTADEGLCLEQAVADPTEPALQLQHEQALLQLERAIRELPERQQQAFMLRTFEGLSVADTATAMRCSAGSVKTHYFRALRFLREQLGEHW